MDPERWRHVERLYHEALACPPAERAAFLAGACDGDQALREEVEGLLDTPVTADGVFAAPALAAAGQLASDPAVSLLTGRRLGVYQLQERIGVGGMGEVYRAHDPKLGRDVALKVLPPELADDPERRTRLLREARAVASLNHPNICTIHEVGEIDGHAYIAMELIEGQPLSVRLADGPLSPDDVVRYGLQLSDALAHAHERGVVHRDVKSANVMITPKGQAKVLDFGLAKRLSGEDLAGVTTRWQDSLTLPGTILGTLPYMAPEQLRGQPADARSDVWALGVVLYEMAAGARPFKGQTPFELTSAIFHDSFPPLPPRMPPPFHAVVSRCLEKEPARRYQRGSEVQAALETLGGGGITAIKPWPVSTRHRSWIITAAAAVAAVAVLAGGVSLIPRFRSREVPPAGKIAVAVLPFRSLSVSQPIRFLGIGIPDAIISRLAGVPHLVPRPTSAILRYENESVDPKDAGRALMSDYVLTGILQEAGDRLGVSVQLVRAQDGAPVWGDHYDVARSDLLTLQDRIAQSVFEALKVQMTAAERERLFRRYTENAPAYEWYLQGRAQLSRSTPESLRTAIGMFEEALKLDPGYAPARAGVAQASAMMRLRFAPASETLAWGERAEREARAALQLDPQLAEAHEALATVYRAVEFEWERTLDESRLALALNPNLDSPHLYRAVAFYHLGLLDLVEPEVQAAADVNPANQVESQRTRGITAVYAGRFQEALPLLEDARRLSGGTTFNWLSAQAYYYTGDLTRADEMSTLRGGTPGDRRAQAIRASLLAARHENAEARALVRAVRDGGFIDHHIAYSLGATYTQLGEFAEARRWLADAARTGLPCYPWYARDPMLDPLRSDPEFRRFLTELQSAWRTLAARYDKG